MVTRAPGAPWPEKATGKLEIAGAWRIGGEGARTTVTGGLSEGFAGCWWTVRIFVPYSRAARVWKKPLESTRAKLLETPLSSRTIASPIEPEPETIGVESTRVNPVAGPRITGESGVAL